MWVPILDNFRQYGVWQGMGEGRVAHSQLAACFSLAYFHTFFTSKRLCCVFCYKNAMNQGFWSKTAVFIKQLFLAFLQQKCIFRWFMVNLFGLSEIISFVKKVQKGKKSFPHNKRQLCTDTWTQGQIMTKKAVELQIICSSSFKSAFRVLLGNLNFAFHSSLLREAFGKDKINMKQLLQ